MVVEKFIGANNLQFEIVECDDTHIPDIKEFCSKVDIENNSTLKSIKFGKWGALEKWWAVYHKNKESLKNIVFEKETESESDLLNEENFKDLGN